MHFWQVLQIWIEVFLKTGLPWPVIAGLALGIAVVIWTLMQK